MQPNIKANHHNNKKNNQTKMTKNSHQPIEDSSGASRGPLHGGASLKLGKAHFAAWKKGPENRKNWWAPRLLHSGGVLVEVFFLKTVVWQLYCALVLRGCNCSAVLLLGSSHTTSLTLCLTRSPDQKMATDTFQVIPNKLADPPK